MLYWPYRKWLQVNYYYYDLSSTTTNTTRVVSEVQRQFLFSYYLLTYNNITLWVCFYGLFNCRVAKIHHVLSFMKEVTAIS